ncbi:UDP-N-acetylmuramoyl-L-alanyl-D-glutamate--2,6-diaminopimelate ligase [bacterium]|jgi:UDP-N-acetylmuramoyl-L-alanyl-D-glutamate--2,6-diaminopimelate ligase|nr:UDP-N-acetylmuramoyl-L-alanyl-D-glutamate--2,6-diaminopimelate ligase [bacterium]MBT4649190.1 UDP-N-acetylmuramoyl-L-alanyl-D-glutamate--2,6-diaminopimelate ligase [bacterium]
MLKKAIKKILPVFCLSCYHWSLARLAAFLFGHPSEKLIVIGVTGTNGKTTTVNLIAQLLECLGNKVGLSSTVNFKLAEKEWLNNKKMTMLGRFQTQALLRQAVNASCSYMVIESSSQGVAQFRHLGINYDLMVFTNLSPEHIEAHGGFDNYRAAKEKLFKHLVKNKRKKINNNIINKIIISNIDDQENKRLEKIKADNFLTYGFKNKADLQGRDLVLENALAKFKVNEQKITTNFLGEFSAYNVLASLAVIKALNLDFKKALTCKLKGVPGRQELVDCKQNFKVMVDYAPEPESLKQLYSAIKELKYNKLIHVLGSCGGGRDKARQSILGQTADKMADVIIITNEDPYDDDPQQIIDKVAVGAKSKEINKNLFKILDRKEAINKALSLASDGDLVLITGKGAEQAICVANNKKIPHDDREVVKRYFQNLK